MYKLMEDSAYVYQILLKPILKCTLNQFIITV